MNSITCKNTFPIIEGDDHEDRDHGVTKGSEIHGVTRTEQQHAQNREDVVAHQPKK